MLCFCVISVCLREVMWGLRLLYEPNVSIDVCVWYFLPALPLIGLQRRSKRARDWPTDHADKLSFPKTLGEHWYLSNVTAQSSILSIYKIHPPLINWEAVLFWLPASWCPSLPLLSHCLSCSHLLSPLHLHLPIHTPLFHIFCLFAHKSKHRMC